MTTKQEDFQEIVDMVSSDHLFSYHQLIERACKEPTLVDALAFIAIFETDTEYETSYRLLFEQVFACWNGLPPYAKLEPSELDLIIKE